MFIRCGPRERWTKTDAGDSRRVAAPTKLYWLAARHREISCVAPRASVVKKNKKKTSKHAGPVFSFFFLCQRSTTLGTLMARHAARSFHLFSVVGFIVPAPYIFFSLCLYILNVYARELNFLSPPPPAALLSFFFFLLQLYALPSFADSNQSSTQERQSRAREKNKKAPEARKKVFIV